MPIKILYLGTNRIYINNTQQLFPLGLASISEITFYGPGYVSDLVLDKGVEEFIKTRDFTFDFVCTDGMIFFWNEVKGTTAFNISYNYFSFKLLKKSIIDMQTFFIRYSGKKILYPNVDFQNITDEEILLLEESNHYLITFGLELLEYKRNLLELNFESFAKICNDNWIYYIKRNQDMVISLPHIIGETEFTFHPIEGREFDISVPGVGYYSRKIINRIINKKKFKVNNRNTSFYQKLNTFLLRKFTTRTNLKVFNQIFNNTIEDSKIAYTCGSGLEALVRKFFEIPAKGTVLFCKPFKGFKEIGFVDGENCVVVNANNIEEKAKSILSNIKEMERLSRNGQNMVFKNHSFIARVSQIEISLNSILKGEFNGSFWDNGDYKLK